MTGPTSPTPAEQPASRAPASIAAVGRWHKWATLLFLLGTSAAFGLAWLLGYLPFD